MSVYFPIISILIFAGQVYGQHAAKVSITSQEFNDRIELYAINKNPIPVSVKLIFNAKGLDIEEVGSKFKVIATQSTPALVSVLKKREGQGWSYKYNMQVYLGNFYANGHDTSYVYTLPYPQGQSYYLSQGYEGTFSHHNENAIDFVMPEGSQVTAIRGGVVAEVIEHNNDGCPYRSCMKMANSILIYHQDGTFARYAHLKYNGALVNVGDRIEVGDPIGLSGNTGWSSQPHLHFSVFELDEGNITYSIPTRFYTEEGVNYLDELRDYRRPQ